MKKKLSGQKVAEYVLFVAIAVVILWMMFSKNEDADVPLYMLNKYYVSKDNGVTFTEMTESEAEAFEVFYDDIIHKGRRRSFKEKVKEKACLIVARDNKADPYGYNAAYYIYENDGEYELYQYASGRGKLAHVYPYSGELQYVIEALVKALE